MSLRDPGPSRRVVILGLAGFLAGCSEIRPLYAPGSAAGGGPQDFFRQVSITEAGNRLTQKIRNELVFAFNGGDEPVSPAYRLQLRVMSGSVSTGAEKYQKLTASTLIELNVGFQLVEIATGRVVFQGTSFANASYDNSSQRFANYRARIDAQDRAALVVAGDLRTKLAAWYASQPVGR